MFNFLRALNNPASSIDKATDNVIYDDESHYLYFDFGNQDNDRKVVKAPTSANAASYDGSQSGTTVTTVQDALDQIYAALGFTVADIIPDDENESVIITGGMVNDVQQSITIFGIEADDETEAFIVS